MSDVPGGHHAGLNFRAVAVERAEPDESEHRELPVQELLQRARPLPPHEEMAIDGLSDEEGEAFLAAVKS